MSLHDRLLNEMKEAMRSGNQTKVSTIRMLRATIKNREIQKGRDSTLTGQELLEIISSAIKQRLDAIEQFTKGGRQDLVDQEQNEIKVLKTFLPEPLSREDLINTAKDVILETEAKGPKDMGKVMKALMPRIVGRAEGASVSQVVKDLLKA